MALRFNPFTKVINSLVGAETAVDKMLIANKRNPMNPGDRSITRIINKDEHDRLINSYLAQIRPQIQNLVRKFLISNYRESGIGQGTERKSTGHLLGALGLVEVILFMSHGRLRMKVLMPANYAPYEGQMGREAFYKAANSINSGWVAGGSSMTKKQRKTMKDVDAGSKVSKIRRQSMEAGKEGAPGAHIIAARPYFYLKQDQVLYIKDTILTYVKGHLPHSQR